MDYIAHFSVNNKNQHVCFAMALSADDSKQAMDRLEQEILTMANSGDSMFDGIQECYLDSLVEMAQIPKTPLLIHSRTSKTKDANWEGINLFDPEKYLEQNQESIEENKPAPRKRVKVS